MTIKVETGKPKLALRESKYDDMLEALLGLKAGQWVRFKVDDEFEDQAHARNVVYAALASRRDKIPFVWRVKKLEDGDLAILRANAPATKKKATKKKATKKKAKKK